MDNESKTTAAQRKAIYKYDDKFERVNGRFPVGTKKRIERAGYSSINKFILQAVSEKLDKIEAIK